MTESKYHEVETEVMASISSVEIFNAITRYDCDEYDEMQFYRLSQHLHACACREIVYVCFGIELTWAESDISILHQVANNLRIYLNASEGSLNVNLSPQTAAFIMSCGNADCIDVLNDEGKFTAALFSVIRVIAGMLSEIMMIHLGMNLVLDSEDGYIYLSAKSVSYNTTELVHSFIFNDSDCTIVGFYESIQRSI